MATETYETDETDDFEYELSTADGSPIVESADWEQIDLGINDFKLDARFDNDRTIHESYNWEGTGITEWRQIRKIGDGGYSIVFLQEEVGKERFRAVKRIYRQKPSHFKRELNALIQARDRKELFVEFFNWYEDKPNDFTFLAMEYLEHGDLKRYMQDNPAEAKENVRKITEQLLQGLKVLHEKGIIHRDLKPQNVLIASTSPITVKLTDFGVSRVLTEDKSMTTNVGTDAYKAPELLGLIPPFCPLKRYTFSVDVWGLGCIVYELLTAEKPFQDPDRDMDTTPNLLRDFCSAKVGFPVKRFRPYASNRAIFFVKRLLVADPVSRVRVAEALDLVWLLDSPSDVFQESEVMKQHFTSLGMQLQLEYNNPLLLACRQCHDNDTITPILASLTKWDILVLTYVAASKGYTTTVKMLSRYMSKGTAWAEWPLMPLQVAAECGHIGVVELLLGVEGVVNPITTPLIASNLETSPSGHLGVVQLLLAKAIPTSNPFKDRTLLQAAAEGGSLNVVELLLDRGAEVNAKPCRNNGRTALQAAAGAGHLDVVKRLLEHSADVNAQPCESGGRTALQAAAQCGHLKIVELLLEHNAEANAIPSPTHGRTALQAAAEGGYLEVAELLLKNHADVNAEACKVGGIKVLQAAAEGGHFAVLKLLLDYGVEVNTKLCALGGRSILHAAAIGGHTEVVELLCARVSGWNVNGAPPPSAYEGRTLLQAAAEGGDAKIVKQLILSCHANFNAPPCANGGRTALQAAAGSGHIKVVELLLRYGASVNASPARFEGRTALQAAAEGGHLRVVELLREHDAEINAAPCENGGRTALQAAAGGGHVEVLELLISSNAHINHIPSASNGRTALQAAAGCGHLKTVKLLLGYGAKIDAAPCKNGGRTALQAAAEGGHVEILKVLISHNSDINIDPCKEEGRTALQAAAEGGHVNAVELLLENGAKVNAKSCANKGRTALQAAAEGGHVEVMKLLFGKGAKVNTKPCANKGWTALQAAAKGGHVEAVELLLKHRAEVNAKPCPHYGQTALQAARSGNHTAVERLLLSAEAL